MGSLLSIVCGETSYSARLPEGRSFRIGRGAGCDLTIPEIRYELRISKTARGCQILVNDGVGTRRMETEPGRYLVIDSVDNLAVYLSEDDGSEAVNVTVPMQDEYWTGGYPPTGGFVQTGYGPQTAYAPGQTVYGSKPTAYAPGQTAYVPDRTEVVRNTNTRTGQSGRSNAKGRKQEGAGGLVAVLCVALLFLVLAIVYLKMRSGDGNGQTAQSAAPVQATEAPAAPESTPVSGETPEAGGENWSIYHGVLTYHSDGPMEDFTGTVPPWYSEREYVVRIVVQEGTTTIGDYVFSDFPHLTSVELPAGLTSIGKGAFAENGALRQINFPEGLETIGDKAFYACASLNDVNLPESLRRIGDSAFYFCDSLTHASFQGGEERWNTVSVGTGNEALVNALGYGAASPTPAPTPTPTPAPTASPKSGRAYTHDGLAALARETAARDPNYFLTSPDPYNLELQIPEDHELLDEPYRMKVSKVADGQTAINLIPIPRSKPDTGIIGNVPVGAEVTVVAETAAYYLIVTDDGKVGWNGKSWFEKPTGSSGGSGQSTGLKDGVYYVIPYNYEWDEELRRNVLFVYDDQGKYYAMPVSQSFENNVGSTNPSTYILIEGEYKVRIQKGEIVELESYTHQDLNRAVGTWEMRYYTYYNEKQYGVQATLVIRQDGTGYLDRNGRSNLTWANGCIFIGEDPYAVYTTGNWLIVMPYGEELWYFYRN